MTTLEKPPRPVAHARDLDDDDVLAAVETAAKLRGHSTATRWDVAAVLAGFPERVPPGDVFGEDIEAAVPQKVLLAKCRRLVRRGRMDGCICGCRGDLRRYGQEEK